MDGLASNHLWRPDLENGLGLERHRDYGLGLLVKMDYVGTIKRNWEVLVTKNELWRLPLSLLQFNNSII